MRFSLKTLLLLSLSEIISIALIYMGTLSFRFSQFGQETFTPCFTSGLNTQELQECTSMLITYYLTKPDWLALQFTVLVIPTTWIAYHFLKKCHQPFEHSLIASLITALGVFLAMDVFIIGLLSAGYGIILGGLMAKKHRQKNH